MRLIIRRTPNGNWCLWQDYVEGRARLATYPTLRAAKAVARFLVGEQGNVQVQQ